MEDNQETQTEQHHYRRHNSGEHALHWLMHGFCILALVFMIAWGQWKGVKPPQPSLTEEKTTAIDNKNVQTVELPVSWDDLGKRMSDAGVIDRAKLEAIYKQRGGLSAEDKTLLEGTMSGNIKVTQRNAAYLLNLFWALGLSNKNTILEQGPMISAEFGNDASRFASTGGWTLARGNAMDHYSMHRFMNLTPEQQALVERTSKNIYRPCCNNSTYFPDCNHGMAMLGLLELLASKGVSENQMYRTALQMNAFWFADQYATLTSYFNSIGVDPRSLSPQEVLGPKYSSGSGFQDIASRLVQPEKGRGGGGCGV